MDNKQRLFEIMGNVNPEFKKKEILNENSLNEATDQDKYESVVFLQGEEADEPLKILNDQGEDAALEYLKQWHDYGHHMGSDSLSHGSNDGTYEKDGYHMSWNTGLDYIGLDYEFPVDDNNESMDESDEHERYSKYNSDTDSRLQKYTEEHEPDTSWIEIKNYLKKEADKFNMKSPKDALDKYFELVDDFLEKQENKEPKLNEGNEINPKYTHFAALKDGNKIVNGWDYNGYDPEDLKAGKKEYFFNDIIDMDFKAKDINVLTKKTLEKRGIDPFDTNNWYKFEAEGWRDKDDLDETENESNI